MSATIHLPFIGTRNIFVGNNMERLAERLLELHVMPPISLFPAWQEKKSLLELKHMGDILL
jgi:hypothetical protein